MFRIDMSGFKARGDIATLVGAPKGYQDSKDGGTLTTFMASHPVRSNPTTMSAFCFDKVPQTFERGSAGMLFDHGGFAIRLFLSEVFLSKGFCGDRFES